MHISVTFASANLVSAIRFPAISSSSPPRCSSSYTKCPFAAQFHCHPPRGVVQLRPDHSRLQSTDGMMRVLLLRSLVHPLHGLCLRPRRSHGDVCVMRIPNAAINSFRIPRNSRLELYLRCTPDSTNGWQRDHQVVVCCDACYISLGTGKYCWTAFATAP